MSKPALKPPVDITTLRAIVRVMQSGGAVDFDPERGVICNLCGHHAQGKGLGVTKTMYQSGGLRERYHTCPNCGRRFKSVEARAEYHKPASGPETTKTTSTISLRHKQQQGDSPCTSCPKN